MGGAPDEPETRGSRAATSGGGKSLVTLFEAAGLFVLLAMGLSFAFLTLVVAVLLLQGKLQ